MFKSRCSLNPHAHSFIPSKKSETVKEMAAKSVVELYERKKATGESTVTIQEIAKLVGHLISIGFYEYQQLTDSNKIKIQNFFNKKLLSSKIPAVKPVAEFPKIRSKLTRRRDYFDISRFQMPPVSFLLVAFWGLHRHEQAQRPLLSLTFRPHVVKDKIWSVDAFDKKLWNKSCISQVCTCPPIFGYSVPSNFFGELSHVHYSCPVQKIHLNHYSESTEGNEFILTDNRQHDSVDEQPFEDVEFDINIRSDVGVLKNQFETTLSGICDLLAKFTDDPYSETEDNEVDDENHYYTSFWDDIDSTVSHLPFFQQSRESLVDDNDHPLLEAPYMSLEEEVPLEVKEMIRKSLCPKEDKLTFPNIAGIDEKKVEAKDACHPPCSAWCDSAKKDCNFEEAGSEYSVSVQDLEDSAEKECNVEAVSKLSVSVQDSEDSAKKECNFEDVSKYFVSEQEPENFNDALMMDLFSLEQLYSKEKVEPINITPASSLNFCGKSKPSQCFSSVVDWYSNSYGKKFDFSGVSVDASNLTMLPYPVKSDRSVSWEDSGFISRSSSEEDVFGEICDRDSTWKFVIGEDSLWKPLPECVETNDTQMYFPHKRVHGLKRQSCAI